LALRQALSHSTVGMRSKRTYATGFTGSMGAGFHGEHGGRVSLHRPLHRIGRGFTTVWTRIQTPVRCGNPRWHQDT
jgi:hypothetical protein